MEENTTYSWTPNQPEKPKKKKRRHLKQVSQPTQTIVERLTSGQKVLDHEVRHWLSNEEE